MGYELWPELCDRLATGHKESSRLGYELWPEPSRRGVRSRHESSRLGYELWPEPDWPGHGVVKESSRLGYELWPELKPHAGQCHTSLVDWDMSSGRRRWLDRRFAPVKPTPAPRRDVYQDWKSANRRIQYVALTLLFS